MSPSMFTWSLTMFNALVYFLHFCPWWEMWPNKSGCLFVKIKEGCVKSLQLLLIVSERSYFFYYLITVHLHIFTNVMPLLMQFLYAFVELTLFFYVIGKNFEKVCETCHITLNKVALFGDNGTITPGGVRIGKRWLSLSFNSENNQMYIFLLIACSFWQVPLQWQQEAA